MHLYVIANESFGRYQHMVMQIFPILMNFLIWHPKALFLRLPMISWEMSECIGGCHAPSGRRELSQIPVPLGSSSLTLTTSAILCFLWVTSFPFVHFFRIHAANTQVWISLFASYLIKWSWCFMTTHTHSRQTQRHRHRQMERQKEKSRLAWLLTPIIALDSF